jgi:hypothetical protein
MKSICLDPLCIARDDGNSFRSIIPQNLHQIPTHPAHHEACWFESVSPISSMGCHLKFPAKHSNRNINRSFLECAFFDHYGTSRDRLFMQKPTNGKGLQADFLRGAISNDPGYRHIMACINRDPISGIIVALIPIHRKSRPFHRHFLPNHL